METILKFVLLCCIVWHCTSRSVAQSWAKTYGGGAGEGAAEVLQKPDGSFVALGWTTSFSAGDRDLWLVNLDQAGNVLSQRAIGGPSLDVPSQLQPTADGGYVAIGLSSSFGAFDHAPIVLKLDSDGNIQWQKTYRVSFRDWGAAIRQTNDGGYIIAGGTDPGNGNTVPAALRLDSAGTIVWQNTFGPGCGNGTDIVQTSDGGFAFLAFTCAFGAGGTDTWLVKLDPSGVPVWQNTYGGSGSEVGTSLETTRDGGFIVAGRATSFGSGGQDAWLLKLAGDGTVVWQKAYGGPSNDSASHVEQTADGGYIVSGYFGAISADPPAGSQMWVFKTDIEGNVVWQRTYNSGSGSDEARSVHAASDGGYIVAGFSDPGCPQCVPAAMPQKFSILKLKSDGSIADTCPAGMGRPANAVTTTTNITPQPAFAGFTGAGFVSSDTATTVTPTDSLGQVLTTFCSDATMQSACSASVLDVDKHLSNGMIDASVSGSACEATITFHNLKGYWANFTINTVGNVTAIPEGGDLNLYARFGLLPPSTFPPLPPGKSVTYTVRFSKDGEAISIFDDPSATTSFRAGLMNVTQAILNLIPLGGTPTLLIDDHQTIVDAFQQMPHLENAISALFQNPSQFSKATREFLLSVKSPQEITVLATLIASLAANIGVDVIKAELSKLGLGWPFTIVNSLVTSFGELRTALFQYPAGSIQISAH
jgi:hypothetical protein